MSNAKKIRKIEFEELQGMRAVEYYQDRIVVFDRWQELGLASEPVRLQVFVMLLCRA